jgi:hypothetical protein
MAAAVAEHRNPKQPLLFLGNKKKGGCWKEVKAAHEEIFFIIS